MMIKIKNLFKKVFGVTPDHDLYTVPTETAEHLINGKAVAFNYYDVVPIEMLAGDALSCSVRDDDGVLHEVREDCDMQMKVDRIAIFRFKDALGFEQGIGGIFGTKEK